MIYIGDEERDDGGGIMYAVKAGASGDISLKDGETVPAKRPVLSPAERKSEITSTNI
jgi:hypothetical protein